MYIPNLRATGLLFGLILGSASAVSAEPPISDYRGKVPNFRAVSSRSALDLEYCIAPSFGAYGVPITVRGEGVTEINIMLLVSSNYINASITVRDLGDRRIVELRSNSTTKGNAKFEMIVKSCLG